MVVGEDPKSLMAPFDAKLKVEPYVKYEFSKADKYLQYAIMSLKAVLAQKHELKLEEHLIENIKGRISILKKVTPFEYYQAITNGMEYNEDGDALSDVNPQAKWITCKEPSTSVTVPMVVPFTCMTAPGIVSLDASNTCPVTILSCARMRVVLLSRMSSPRKITGLIPAVWKNIFI